MKKNALAARLARQAHLSTPAAADELDRSVHKILTRLRQGQKVSIPGLGEIRPGRTPKLLPEKLR